MGYYGKDENGFISLCRAKPENRGKGRCRHTSHEEADYTTEELSKKNEIELAQAYDPSRPASRGEKIHSPGGGRSLSPTEFNEATSELSEAFPQEDWEFINSFYEEFSTAISVKTPPGLASSETHAVDSVYSYLTSDSPLAAKLRGFLGDSIDLKTFAEILVNEPRSMRSRAALRNSKKRDTAARIVTTHLNNDMTKERYIASVLYFAGRCCYCKCVLSNDESEAKATGEHITPLSPEDESGVYASTRFGNMALACLGCNNEKANAPLEAWIAKTKRIPKADKTKAVECIAKFRQFALYSEYSVEASQKIRAVIGEVNALMRSYPSVGKVYEPEIYEKLKDQVYSRIVELGQELA